MIFVLSSILNYKHKRYWVQIPEEDYPKLDNMNCTVEYLPPLMQA